MAEIKDEELLPFGWAPGGYTINCSKCPDGKAPMGRWGAKRSWRCREHAVEDLEEIRRRVRVLTTPKSESAPAAGDQKITVDGERVLGIETVTFAANYNIDSGPIGPIIQGCLDLVDAGLMVRVGPREFRKKV